MKKHKLLLRVVCLLIASIFILAAVLPLIIRAAGEQDKIDEMQQELQQVKKQQEQLENSIKAANKKKQSQMKQKNQLDKQINVYEHEIDLQENLISQYSKKISEKEAVSKSLQQKIDEKYALYLKRIRSNFEEGTPSILTVLFDSNSVSDFLTRLEFAETVMEYDNNLINELKRNRAQVLQVKAEIEQDKISVEQHKTGLVKTKKNLDAKSAESSKIINTLNTDISEYKKAYEEAEKQEKKLQNELTKLLASLADSNYVGGKMIWPTPGYTTIKSEYGMRLHPILKVYKLHTGVDIAAKNGSKILAANAGKVLKAAYDGAYGNYILIDHGGGISTLYAHMSKMLVKAGSTVKAGQEIGKVGSTGYSTGPHLHLEVRVNGKTVNPLTYFKK